MGFKKYYLSPGNREGFFNINKPDREIITLKIKCINPTQNIRKARRFKLTFLSYLSVLLFILFDFFKREVRYTSFLESNLIILCNIACKGVS